MVMSAGIWLLMVTLATVLTSQLANADSETPVGKPNAADAAQGHSIELVAIVRMDKEKPFAWTPQGAKIEISEKWGRITEVRDLNPTHGFVFRCQGFSKGQNLGWRDIRPGATPILKDEIPEWVTVSAKIKEGSTTKIRVGVMGEWGPWRRVHPNGMPADEKPVPKAFQELYGFVKSVETFEGNRNDINNRLKYGFGLNGVVGNKQVVDLCEYEVVAIDGDGKRHHGTGVGIWKGGQIPYFGLTEDDLAFFEYRMRPYTEWVTFENIPLKPSNDARMKVSREKTKFSNAN
jgi:hypothetical protein